MKMIKRREIDKSDLVYNLHIKNDHNYIVEGAVVKNCHTAKGSVLTKLIEQATNTPIKHGLTGTLDGCEVNELVIQGLLGPAKRIVTANDIIEKGRASPVDVSMVLLEHGPKDRQELFDLRSNLRGSMKYQTEVEFINAMKHRRDFIFGMIDSLEGNTLVLFDRVEGYGKELYESYLASNPDRTFLITGDVDSSERETIRTSMDDHDNAVIWASYGTMSTGISIRRLHNLVLVSSSKSKIRVLQSIGRLMRLHATKDKAQILDIVDDLTWNKNPNYTMKHAVERLEYYKTEKFPVNFMRIPMV